VYRTGFLEGQCPTEFSSNPDQTHLSKLNKILLDNHRYVNLIRVWAVAIQDQIWGTLVRDLLHFHSVIATSFHKKLKKWQITY